MWHCQELILMCPIGKRRGRRSRGDDAACQSWAVVALLFSEDGAGGRKRRKESICCWACGRCFCLSKTALPSPHLESCKLQLEQRRWTGVWIERRVFCRPLRSPKPSLISFPGLVLCCWLKSKIWKENHRRLCICLLLFVKKQSSPLQNNIGLYEHISSESQWTPEFTAMTNTCWILMHMTFRWSALLGVVRFLICTLMPMPRSMFYVLLPSSYYCVWEIIQ